MAAWRNKSIPKTGAKKWVPAVPDGWATKHLKWHIWVFLQHHIGVFRTHRSAKKTKDIIVEVAWWSTMVADINLWTLKCITCIRFRMRPTKQDAIAVIPTHLHP